jgi:hypothetical protein
MAMPRRRDGEDGEAPREETTEKGLSSYPSRSRESAESGESGDAGALIALSAPDSPACALRIPPLPAGVGPRTRPSRSEGEAGGTGSVVSNAMKSPSPLSEFCLPCAVAVFFSFSFARVSSARGLRRTTRGLNAFAPPASGGKPEEGGSGVNTAPGSDPRFGGFSYVFCS